MEFWGSKAHQRRLWHAIDHLRGVVLTYAFGSRAIRFLSTDIAAATLAVRSKRSARKTLCFSESVLMQDTVIGLFANRSAFGTPISFSRSTR